MGLYELGILLTVALYLAIGSIWAGPGELMRTLRDEGSETPILIVSAVLVLNKLGGATLIACGMQTTLSALFIGVLGLRRR